jgi:hypothetical protein
MSNYLTYAMPWQCMSALSICTLQSLSSHHLKDFLVVICTMYITKLYTNVHYEIRGLFHKHFYSCNLQL